MGQLHKIIRNIDIDESVALFLTNCIISKLRICRKTKTWNIIIASDLTCSGTDKLDEIKKVFNKLFPYVSNFNIEILITQKKCLIDFEEKNWSELYNYLTASLPVAAAFLADAVYTVNSSNKISISVANNAGLKLFENKIIGSVKEFFITFYEVEVEVELTVDILSKSTINLEEQLQECVTRLIQKNISPNKTDKISIKNPAPHGSAIILGKDKLTELIPIIKIKEEEKNITIGGNIFNIEERVFKTGRKLITFDITDKTDSITVKLFSPEKGKLYEDKLTNNAYVLIYGSVKYDNFSNELAMFPVNIKLSSGINLEDNASVKRVELHLHTQMSSMDGVSSLEQYIALAAKWGHSAIAITDHGVIQAFPDAYELGKKYQVKILYGVEAYLADDMEDNPDYLKTSSYHTILLVKDYEGLKNLYKLISESHLEYFYRRPKIPKSILTKFRKGLLVGSACEAGELITKYLKGATKEELKEIANYYDFLEVQPIGNNEFLIRNGTCSEKDLQQMNKSIISLGEELNKLTVATGDVHFLAKEDAVFREILMHGKGYEDANLQPPLYYRTTKQMLVEFSYLDEETAHKVVVENTRKIADLIEDVKPIPDEFYPPHIPGAEQQIIEMTKVNAHNLYGEELPEIVDKRIIKELDSIINNGFAVLYLISHKLVKKSNEDGYLVGSRGSVGSSFVATLTGITEVNPLPPHYRCSKCKYSDFIEDGSVGCGADLADKNCPNCGEQLIKDGHDIPFEVFLGFKGDKVPDIDLNFSGEYQGTIMNYTEELFGKSFVYRAGTIATVAERTAYGFVKKYIDENKINARTAELNRLVKGCSGVKRTTGQHPGGLMIVPKDKDVFDFTPIQRPANDMKSNTVTTHFDYHAISSRLVKLDILGHDDPTAIKMLEDLTGVNVKTIPLDEPKTLSLFSGTEALGVSKEETRSTVGTYGIPEFGTRFVRQMLEDTKPKTFSELVRISGFSHGTDVWLNNAQELIKEGVAKLSEAISTRDDIMIFLIYQGVDPVVAFKIMEDVRKGKGITPEQEAAMVKVNIPPWYIESCKKIKYMFPKAHAVAYVMMAFRIAFFKVYYPEVFYATFFTVRADEFDAQLICQGPEVVLDKIIELENKGNEISAKEKNLLTIIEVTLEMYRRGIKLTNVSLLESHSHKFLLTDKGILPPLASLQGVGQTAANNIMQARTEKWFNSIEDLRDRSRVSKTVIEALADHGCLEGIPSTSQLELF